jgi:hypothetical protein
VSAWPLDPRGAGAFAAAVRRVNLTDIINPPAGDRHKVDQGQDQTKDDVQHQQEPGRPDLSDGVVALISSGAGNRPESGQLQEDEQQDRQSVPIHSQSRDLLHVATSLQRAHLSAQATMGPTAALQLLLEDNARTS